MTATAPLHEEGDFPAIRRGRLETVQVNIGYVCNLTCFHCHVNAGPNRRENMDRETADDVLAYIRASGASVLDLTGGAPEMNPNFRYMVVRAREMGLEVIDRSNLTILEQPGYDHLAEFLAEHRVQVIASLPCYSRDNVDKQRGDGVFDASITALQRLNRLGYGHPDSGLILHLIYNPLGPSLPPSQETLEATYKQALAEDFGIVFNSLFTLANMPIHRFAKQLHKEGQYDAYMALLKEAHRDENIENVMCRSLVSIDWRGYVYDCDFNQMLTLPMGGRRRHVSELVGRDLTGEPIAVADHCFGCTAGQGSSCTGALG